MSELCRDYVGIMSGLCRDYVGIMSGLCRDFVGKVTFGTKYHHIKTWHAPKNPGACFLPEKKPLRERTRPLKACKNQGTGPNMTQTHKNTHFSQKGHVSKSRNVFFWGRKAPAGAYKTAKSLYKSRDRSQNESKTHKYKLFPKGACLKNPGTCSFEEKKPLRERPRPLKA